MTLRNLLFWSRWAPKLVAHNLIEGFDWLSYRKKVYFVQGQGQKYRQKHQTKEVVEFHNHLHALTMNRLPCRKYYIICYSHSRGNFLFCKAFVCDVIIVHYGKMNRHRAVLNLIKFTCYVRNIFASSLLFYSQFRLNLFLIYNETIKGFRGFLNPMKAKNSRQACSFRLTPE